MIRVRVDLTKAGLADKATPHVIMTAEQQHLGWAGDDDDLHDDAIDVTPQVVVEEEGEEGEEDEWKEAERCTLGWQNKEAKQ